MGRTTGTKRIKQTAEQHEPLPQLHTTNKDPHETAVRERLQAARLLLENGLARLQQVIEQRQPLAAPPSVQGIDIDDSRAFFLEKFQNIRASLQNMAEQLNLPAIYPENKQILDLELLALMVVVERTRAPQIATGDSEFDGKVREVLNDTIESVVLDLLNLRARLK